MKKFLLVLFLALTLALPSLVWAAGSCVLTSKELVEVEGRTQRVYINLTCTGDGTIAAYTLTPASQGLKGYYLYSVTTGPGAPPPTNLYDVTLLVNAEDIAGGLLANRSSTVYQTVVIAPATLGYHMSDDPIIITFAAETDNPSILYMTLRFTAN